MEDVNLSEFIHEMISDKNSEPKGKVFYYTEEEVLQILKESEEYTSRWSSRTDLTPWWESHKKK